MENKRRGAAMVPVLVTFIALSAGTGAIGAAAKKAPPKKKPPANAATIAQGKKFVEADGCLACHKIGAKGGPSGPELTKIGANAKWKLPALVAKIKNPKVDKADSIMPASRRPNKEITAMATYLASLK